MQGKKRLAIRDSFIKETGPRLIHLRQHHAFRLYLFALWCYYPRGRPRLPQMENKEIAALLGIGGRGDSGRSAVGHVLAVLEERHLLLRIHESNQRMILVCHESGDGREYSQPKGGGPNAYVEVSSGFFANGWLNKLSAPATLVMLIALREQRYQAYRRTQDQRWDKSFDWFQSVARLSKEYSLGKTTIEKGIRELKSCGFLTSRLTARHPKHRGSVFPRNLYSNHPDVFGVRSPEEGAGGPENTNER